MPTITAKPITATPITARPLTAYRLGESTEGASVFNPISLFASGEDGAYFDAATIATLLQDAAGTTPVTAVGQPIGLLLDQSQGTVDLTGNLGPELVTNGGFDTDTGWTFNASALAGGVEITGGQLVYTSPHTDYANVNQLNKCVVGKRYKGVFEVVSRAEVTTVVTIQVGRANYYNGQLQNLDVGFHEFIVTATHTDGFSISVRTNGEIVIDNVSVREVPGNHASQATSTARPVLAELSGARYINFDGVDDDFDVTLPDLGTSATIALIAADGTVSYQESQTISGAITLSTDFQKLLYIDRALTAAEKASWESLA